MSSDPYRKDDYTDQVAPSLLSARRVLPLVIELLSPRSILDVGCGAGSWMAAALELGIEDVLGIEGGHPSDDALQVPRDMILTRDLRDPVDLGRTLDLAISVEVAEHIPAEFADRFVLLLGNQTDAVLLSATVHGQGGLRHVNEQWPDCWADRLAPHGFQCFDPFRLTLGTTRTSRGGTARTCSSSLATVPQRSPTRTNCFLSHPCVWSIRSCTNAISP